VDGSQEPLEQGGDAGEQVAEAARLLSLGARLVDWEQLAGGSGLHIVLDDPEGNRFCVVDLSHEHA
jgi:hypothetical protein